MTGDIERVRMRASDGDRELVAQRLRTAFDEGRLDLVDYDERLRDAYAARTYGDLDLLTVDLPAAVRAPIAPAAARSRWAEQQGEWGTWGGVAIVLITIWAITSLLSGGLLPFWPAFPIGIWAAVLLASMLGGRSRGSC